MRFSPGLWQHMSCTDLQLEIIKVQYRGPRYTKVKALYVRKDFGCGSYVLDYQADTLKIRKTEYLNWYRLE